MSIYCSLNCKDTFYSLNILYTLYVHFTIQTHRPTKNFLSSRSKDKDLVQVWEIRVNKAWFRCLTQFRLMRHQPRALAGAIRKETLSAEIVRLICRTYPLASLRIKLTPKKAEPRDGRVTDFRYYLNTQFQRLLKPNYLGLFKNIKPVDFFFFASLHLVYVLLTKRKRISAQQANQGFSIQQPV